MTRYAVSALAIALGALALPSAAMASSQEDLNTCRAEIESQAAGKYENASFKFKGASGGSLRKLKFSMTADDAKGTVVCKIKKGEVKEVVWPN